MIPYSLTLINSLNKLVVVQFEVDSLAVSCYPINMADNLRKHPKRPRDVNQHAASTVALVTSEVVEATPEVTQVAESTQEERHIAAVTLGKKGGQSRAKNLTPEQRKEIAKKAAQTRWSK